MFPGESGLTNWDEHEFVRAESSAHPSSSAGGEDEGYFA